MAYKTKADKMFQEKLETALSEKDFVTVELLFHQYGCYLQLITPFSETVDMTALNEALESAVQ